MDDWVTVYSPSICDPLSFGENSLNTHLFIYMNCSFSIGICSVTIDLCGHDLICNVVEIG